MHKNTFYNIVNKHAGVFNPFNITTLVLYPLTTSEKLKKSTSGMKWVLFQF